MRPIIKNIGLVIAMLGAVACTTLDEGDGAGEDAETATPLESLLDVNDVSILFSYEQSKRSVTPDIPVTKGDLLTSKHFEQVIAFAMTKGIRGQDGQSETFPLRPEDRARWKVFALRFDPCAPGLAVVRADATLPKEKQRFGGMCEVQLRLIAQPYLGEGDFPVPSDYAAHLTFTLANVKSDAVAKDPVVRAMVDRLVQIKKLGATAGKPLGVHPILAGRGPAKAKAAKAIEELIADATHGKIDGTQFAVTRRIAFMGLRPGRGKWTFVAGGVDPKSDTWTASEKLPGHLTSSQSLDQVGQEDIADRFKVTPPPTAAVASTFELFDDTQPVAEEDIAQAFAVENPTKVDFFTTDCVSCHSSSSRLAQVQIEMRDQEGGTRTIGTASALASRMPVPPFVTGYVAPFSSQMAVWDTRNFGYFGEDPSVSGRTVNETSEVVAFINQEVLQAGIPEAQRAAGPGLRCPDDAKAFVCSLLDEDKCLDKCVKPDRR